MKEIINPIEAIEEMADALNGKIETISDLPDGSGYATMSYPLPKEHWLTAEGWNEPPMPLRMGTDDPKREQMAKDIWAATKYAIRASTMNGKADWDPDAVCQNMVVGLIGYWTPDGTSKL